VRRSAAGRSGIGFVLISDAKALQAAYLEACEEELQAFKPGNVSVHSEGHDMSVADFRRSAEASAPYLCDSALGLGERIYHAIRATREAVACNTNLGIVLLAAPLILACQQGEKDYSLRENLGRVLSSTSQEDANWVFRAICLASPGGLGRVQEHDVAGEARVTLLEAMEAASDRDMIAFQYANDYATVFELAIPSYHTAFSRWRDGRWAAVAVFAKLLRQIPDSHIGRKFGDRFTGMVSDRMARIDEALSRLERPELLLELLREADAEFKSAGINPGTTADLTVTCLLAVRLQGLLDARAA
jgi:triphosphoribosyl-dephospho-CoA synthase